MKGTLGCGAIAKVVICLALLTAGRARADEIIDRVLAVAGGDVIMLSDVRAALELGMISAGSAPDPVRAALSTLIDRSLVLDEVNRYAPPEPATADVDRALADLRARSDSAQAFERVLARVGLDEGQLREILRQNLRIRAYLDQRFTADTPEHVRTAIDEWTAGLRRRADIVDLYSAIGR